MNRKNERNAIGSIATGKTFHLTTVDVWAAQEKLRRYRPQQFDDDGFIHCTDGEENLVAVGNRYYRNDPRSFLALEIDLSRVISPACYEDVGRVYPHIYGPLEVSSVISVRRVARADDGTFLAVGDAVCPDTH